MSKLRLWAGLIAAIVIAGAAVYFGFLRGRQGPGTASVAGPMNVAALVSGMSDDEKQQAYKDEVEQLQGRLTRLQSYLDGFPAALTDVEALSRTLTTPQAAFEFVRDQVAFEPYPGIMKGPRATLVTRGGNSIDRALLLAAILEHNGVSARIARGRLSPDRARALLEQAGASRSATEHMLVSLPVKSPAATPTAHQQDIINAVGRRADSAANAVRTAVDQTHPVVEASVKNASLPRAAHVRSRQLEILSDHYWVQATIDDQTIDLDPSLTSAQPNQKLAEAAESFEPGSAPDDLFQRVKFRIVAEFLENGRIRSTDILAEEATATDLFGKNIRLALAPQTPNTDESSCHAILLIGDRRVDGQAFQLSARTGDEESSGENPDTGTGEAAGGLSGVAGGGQGQKPAEKPAPKPRAQPAAAAGAVLGRVYLEVTSVGPRLPEARYRRVIMDRLEPSGSGVRIQPALADDQFVRPLLVQAWDGAVSVGGNNAVFVLQTILDTMKAHESMEEKARAQVYLGESFGVDDLPAPTLSKELIGYFFTSDVTRFLLGRQHAKSARSYYERPRLAFLRHGFVVGDWSRPQGARRFVEGIDLLNAPFQFTGSAADAERLAREAGVADTALEGSMTSAGALFNTLPLFAAAAAQNVRTVTIRPDQAEDLQGIAVPPAIKAVLREELAQGQTLLLPARLVKLNEVDTYGWWSIDPETGLALGKMELGGAQGLTEVTQMHEKIEKWTEIFAKFYGGVMRCYMDALGESLGSIDVLKGRVNVKHGAPGESPMPDPSKLAQCVISQACDTIADLLVEASITPAFAREAEEAIKPLQRLIAEWIGDQMVDYAKGKIQKNVAAACEQRLGGGGE